MTSLRAHRLLILRLIPALLLVLTSTLALGHDLQHLGESHDTQCEICVVTQGLEGVSTCASTGPAVPSIGLIYTAYPAPLAPQSCQIRPPARASPNS